MTPSAATVNPGNEMVNAVNAKVASFRELQQEIAQGRMDLQTLLGQRTENEIVKQELEVLISSNNEYVYKEMGPVLIKQDVSEAKDTVEKRLEFIAAEMSKLEKSLKGKETKASETAAQVQEMQANMQKAAVDAAMAVAASNKQNSQE